MKRWTDPNTGIEARASDEVGARFVAGLSAADAEYRRRLAGWEEEIVGRGIQIAHPDDGWVDRARGTVLFAYPTFQQAAPAPGVRVALGTPDRWRLVELTHRVPQAVSLGSDRWAFTEEVVRGD